MQKLRAAFKYFWARLFSIMNIPAIVYDIVITQTLTRYVYRDFYATAKDKIQSSKAILDVGIGTGYALESIIGRIPESTNVLGLDIDPAYVKSAQKRFARRKNVEVRLEDFYKFDAERQKFDIIIFSMSIMLMPDQVKAIEIAKSLLADDGRIYFLLTLQNKKNKLLEKIKPIIKYVTTIDFGKVTYENEFDALREKCELTTLKKHRVMPPANPLLKFFRTFTIECVPEKKK